MGAVYLAEHTLLGRRAAIKFLKDAHASSPDRQHLRARFLREAHALSTFSHPHIASVYDYGETQEGKPYIIMEWVDGQTLGGLMSNGKLPLPQSLKLIEDIAEALAEAHRHDIIHRDIKPSNVAINERGQVKVLDFGLAKHVNRDAISSGGASIAQSQVITQTRRGFVPGTPQYVSPEQALDQPLDARSDIFSLGVLLYECVTGEPAFSGGNDVEIYTKVVRDNPPPPSRLNPDVPTKLDAITLKCLAKSADERYQSMEEFLTELREVKAGLRSDGYADRQPHRPARKYLGELLPRALTPPQKRRLYLAATLLGVLVLGVILYYNWPPYKPSYYQPPREALGWYEKGITALHDGTYYKASKLFEEAIKIDDHFALAHARLAEAWMELDYTDKAKDEIIRASDFTSDHLKLSPLDTLRLQAITNTVKRDFAKAAENYRAIIPLVPDPEKPSVRLDLGRAYENNEELERAIEQYSEATRLDKQYAAAFLRLGVVYGCRLDSKADAAFGEALRLFQIPNDVEGVTEVLYQHGLLYNKTDNFDQAQQQLQQALDMGQASISKPQRIKIILQLSSVLYSTGNPAAAQQRAHEATELAQEEGLENLTTNGLVDIGNALMWQGRYSEAENYYNQALQVARINKGLRGEARAQLALGSLYVQEGDAGNALHYIELARAFYQQGNYSKEISQALLLLGRANELQGNYVAAVEAYEQDIQQAAHIGDLSQAAYAHVYLGSLLSYQEKFPQALVHFDESYRTDNDLKAQPRIGYDLLNRGNILWQLGRYDEAEGALDQASSLANQSDSQNKNLLAWVLLFDAQMSLSRQRFDDAISKSRQSLALAGAQYKDVAAQATSALGLAQALSGTQGAGVHSCQRAIDLAKSVGSPRLVSGGQLALAEALLESGDAQDALKTALASQEAFARSGQRHSEWRAWLIAALANGRQGDQTAARDYAARADKLLSEIRREWGEETYNKYLSRPDVQRYRRQLGEILSSGE